jgi:hypothetical protein
MQRNYNKQQHRDHLNDSNILKFNIKHLLERCTIIAYNTRKKELHTYTKLQKYWRVKLQLHLCFENHATSTAPGILEGLGTRRRHVVESSWNVIAHGDAWEGKCRGNWRMEWVASTLDTTSERRVSSITTADAHISAASSRLNWRPRRFKWTRPFRRKKKSGFCACAITFQTQSTFHAQAALPLGEKTQVCIGWAAGRATLPVWTLRRKEGSLEPPKRLTWAVSLCLFRWLVAVTNKPHRQLFQDVAPTDVAGSDFCNDRTFQDRRSEARTHISSISNHRITPHHRRVKFLAQRIPNIRQYVKVSLIIFTKRAEQRGPPAPTCILETPRCNVDWFIGKCGWSLLWFVLAPPVKCRLVPWNGSWLSAPLIYWTHPISVTSKSTTRRRWIT